MPTPEPQTIVAPDGRPARVATGPGPCPTCGAKPSRRVASSGFGQPHDVCGQCGREFEEFTR